MRYMNKISKFVKRLEKLNVKVELFGNYPWIYLDKVNGIKVKNKFHAEHGFTLAFSPIRKDQDYEFTDIKRIFEEIRLTLSQK